MAGWDIWSETFGSQGFREPSYLFALECSAQYSYRKGKLLTFEPSWLAASFSR
jgi:hypothetical protein